MSRSCQNWTRAANKVTIWDNLRVNAGGLLCTKGTTKIEISQETALAPHF